MRKPKFSKVQMAACKRIAEGMTEQSIVLAMKHEIFFYKGVDGVLELLKDFCCIKENGSPNYLITHVDPIFFGAIVDNPWELLSDDFVLKQITPSYKDNLKYAKDSFALLFACGWPEKGMPAKWLTIANDDATCRGILRTIRSKGAPWHNKTARKIVVEEYSFRLLAYLEALDSCVMDGSYPRSKWFVRYVEICSGYQLLPEVRLRHFERLARSIRNQRDGVRKPN